MEDSLMKLSFREFRDRFTYLLKGNVPQESGMSVRSFRAALNNRFVDWLLSSRHKINVDLVTELETLVERSRSLAKNNEIFRSFLFNSKVSVVGPKGFTLAMQVKNADGTLNDELDNEIEDAFKDFQEKQYLTPSKTLDGVMFDMKVLTNLIIDGQCFIQIVKDPKSPFGVRFKPIDAMSIDMHKLQIMTETQNGIINGVEVNQDYRPVRYWMRKGYNGNYESGKLYSVPADNIIHIYVQQFDDQVRGFPFIIASMESLKQLDDYAVAELIAAKIASCQGVFYERNTNTPAGDFISQNQAADDGTFLQELAPGIASVVPKGYSVKTLTPTHPNTDYNAFTKSLLRRVSASNGTCYNKLNKDYSDVNYSSLKQATIDENKQIEYWQQILIRQWKNIQFEIFLKNYLISESHSGLKPSEFQKYIHSYRFIPRVDPFTDPAKQMVAIEKKLKLGLTSHIAQIQKSGGDYLEFLNDEQKWNEACAARGLDFSQDQNQQRESFEDSNLMTDQ